MIGSYEAAKTVGIADGITEAAAEAAAEKAVVKDLEKNGMSSRRLQAPVCLWRVVFFLLV